MWKKCQCSGRGGGFFCDGSALPADLGGVAPEEFEVVEFAVAGGEEVDDDVDEIEKDPMGVFVTVDPDRFGPLLFGELEEMVGGASDLSVGGSGGDDEKIGNRGKGCHIENDEIIAFIIGTTSSQLDG
jgi:hypothetical protein